MAEHTYKRYSLAFKREIVRRVESGELSIGQARRRYGIGGSSTVQRWLKTYGTREHTSKQLRVMMPEEIDRMQSLEAEKRALESALAHAHLKILVLESTIDAASEHFGTDVKKCFGTKPSPRRSSVAMKPGPNKPGPNKPGPNTPGA